MHTTLLNLSEPFSNLHTAPALFRLMCLSSVLITGEIHYIVFMLQKKTNF